ncbi:MAG TPA: Coq4 family protein [Myxococcota bacterium]|nr:Coq4 family protein [Myxococcota bacterium]
MATASVPEIPAAPAGFAQMRWRRAFRALQALLADPDDTAKALDVNLAIGRRDFERSFQRFAASAAGRALLAERPSLASALSDREALERMQPGSLGRDYLEYLDANRFRATGLLELEHDTLARWEREDGLPRSDWARTWFRDRLILTHDLSHVVTGYGTDGAGEAALLVFSQAQLGGWGNGLLTAGATWEMLRAFGPRYAAYAREVWRRGRRAELLVALPWEELLPLRLPTVRRLAGLGRPEDAHPGGGLCLPGAPAAPLR